MQSTVNPPKAEAAEIPPKEVVPLSKPELQALAYKVASADGLNADHFEKTINCESGWNTNAAGDNNSSYGLAQIHLPAHLDIKKEQATNPDFAINYMASQWLQGHESEWSCVAIEQANGWQ